MLVTLSVSKRRQRQEARLATRDRFSFAVNRVPVPAKCTPPLVSEEFVIVLALPCRLCCTALSHLGNRNETIHAGFLLSLTLKNRCSLLQACAPCLGRRCLGSTGGRAVADHPCSIYFTWMPRDRRAPPSSMPPLSAWPCCSEYPLLL